MKKSWRFARIILAFLTISALSGNAAKDDQSGNNSLSQNFTLDILGNANEDNIIDEQDIAYVKGVISGTNSKTNLCDANYDGLIDANDVDYIKQIINGTENKLTLIDGCDNVVSFDLPIEKLAVAHMPEFIVALGEFQKVVGVPSYMLTDDVLSEIYPDIKNLPDFGKTGSFDREALAAIKPDVMIVWDQYPEEIEEIKKLGITVFELNTTKNNKKIDSFRKELMQFGYMFNKVDRAKEIISSMNEIEELVKSRVSAIPEEKRVKGISMNSIEPPKVRIMGEKWEIAGIIDVAEDKIAKSGSEVDIETIVNWDPDIINIWYWSGSPDQIYGSDKWQGLRAVHEKNVNKDYYITSWAPEIELLVLDYAMKAYPESFADVNFNQTYEDFTEELYGVGLSPKPGKI
ncbi:MAG: ABC transporter substrate-binding protein [Methanothrix sp.]